MHSPATEAFTAPPPGRGILRPVMEGAVVAPLAASEVGVTAISAGAALLGAAVGGFATYRVERSRQDHERVLEQQRYDREEATCGREELNFARGWLVFSATT